MFFSYGTVTTDRKMTEDTAGQTLNRVVARQVKETLPPGLEQAEESAQIIRPAPVDFICQAGYLDVSQVETRSYSSIGKADLKTGLVTDPEIFPANQKSKNAALSGPKVVPIGPADTVDYQTSPGKMPSHADRPADPCSCVVEVQKPGSDQGNYQADSSLCEQDNLQNDSVIRLKPKSTDEDKTQGSSVSETEYKALSTGAATNVDMKPPYFLVSDNSDEIAFTDPEKESTILPKVDAEVSHDACRQETLVSTEISSHSLQPKKKMIKRFYQEGKLIQR